MNFEGSVIVTGIPGAGKTTIARALAERATLAAHLDIDAIYELIVGGIVFRLDSPDEDWWQLDLARRNIRMLAKSFAQNGVLPVIDDVVANQAVLDGYLRELPAPIRMIVLAPSLDVVLARDAGRDKQAAAQWTYLGESMTRDLKGVGLWIDTSDLDVQGTIAVIERSWNEALI